MKNENIENKEHDKDYISTVNPATGEVIQKYALMPESEVSSIIEKTHLAYKSWKKTSFAERSEKLLKLAQLLRADPQQYASIITQEMGKPITQSLAEIEKCAWLCEYYAKSAPEHLADRLIKTEKYKTKVCYRPLGIVFAIMPWNYPFWQVFRFLCPTVMAGNAGLLSHASISSGTALAIEQMAEQAGFPKDLFKALILNNRVAAKVIANKRVTGVTLTGSERAGKAIAAEAGQNLKKVVLELGGTDPYLILADADLEQAASACIASRLNNSGQVCIAAKRIIIVESVFAEFEKLIIEKVSNYKMGDPADPNTNFGPIAREDLRATLDDQVQQSIKQGAKLICGGFIPDTPGFYYPPTLLTNIKSNMLPFTEELFGPVVTLIKAKDEADAINIANDTSYGLGGGVFTKDIVRGEKIATDLIESGSVAVNNFVASDPRVPFGGIGLSGFGRELSEEGIREFVNIKSISIDKSAIPGE